MSITITAFEVPRHICLEVAAGPNANRGVTIVTTTTPDVVGLHLYPIPTGFKYLAIHRQIGAPRLIGKLGALVHGSNLAAFDVRCCLEPKGERSVHTLYGTPNWLKLVEVIGSDGPEVAHNLLDRERVIALWGWLIEWVRTGDQRHRITRKGGYRSIEEEREERALHEEMRQAQLAIDDGDHSFSGYVDDQ